MPHPYEGFYARFDTPEKSIGSLMMGADDLVGDRYSIEFKVEDGTSIAWLSNKFGAERGFFDEETSRRVQIAQARGNEVVALLSFVAYSDTPEPGIYWGEMAVICYDPVDAEAMEGFIDRVASMMEEGIRPDINLNAKAVQNIFSQPDWIPSGRVALPDKKKKGFAIMKDHRSASERAIEQGRAGNKGCYAVSYLIYILIAAGLIFGGLKLFGVI